MQQQKQRSSTILDSTMTPCYTPPPHSPRVENKSTSSSSTVTTTILSGVSANVACTATPSPPPTPEQTPQSSNGSDSSSSKSGSDNISTALPTSTSSQPFPSVSCSAPASTACTFSPSSSAMSSSTLLQRQQQQQLHHEQQPFDVINHPVKDTLTIVSTLLSILVHKNDSQYNPLSGSPVTLFHSRAVPRISIEAYLTRILQYIPFTNEVLLNMLVFLDRIGGLEGMHLQQGGTLESTAATSMTVTTMDAPPSLSPSLSSSPCQSISSMKQKKDPELFVGPSSSASIPSPVPCPSSLSNNSDSGFPVVQKRGREDEDLDGNQTKRTRCTVPALSITGTVTAVAFPQPPFPTPPTPAPAASAMASSNNGFKINSFNIHRLLITCLMVAAKFTSDLFYSNARYAKVGGLSLPELNQLELEFLFTTKFELNVKVDELQRVGNALLRFRERHMVRVHQVQQVQQLQMQQQQQEMLQRQLQRQYHQQQQQQMVTMSLPISPCATEAIHSDGKMPVPAPIPASVPAMTTSSTRTQLLSPPEEKHTWTGTEIQHQC